MSLPNPRRCLASIISRSAATIRLRGSLARHLFSSGPERARRPRQRKLPPWEIGKHHSSERQSAIAEKPSPIASVIVVAQTPHMKVTLARSAAPTMVAGYSPQLLGAFDLAYNVRFCRRYWG